MSSIYLAIKLVLRQLFNVARTSVRLHPMRTKVRTTTATLNFLSIKLGFALQGKAKQLCLFLSFPHVFSGNPFVIKTWMPDKSIRALQALMMFEIPEHGHRGV